MYVPIHTSTCTLSLSTASHRRRQVPASIRALAGFLVAVVTSAVRTPAVVRQNLYVVTRAEFGVPGRYSLERASSISRPAESPWCVGAQGKYPMHTIRR